MPSIMRAYTLSRNSESLPEPAYSKKDAKGLLGLNLLHSAPNPLVDIIFVHGLGGGSRKTWMKSDKSTSFWPGEWLPRDADFGACRIHSFGYESDWQRKDAVLDINDFARSLIGEISNNPGFRKSKTGIVMVGHSMGGIVIKKAYLLARQDPALQDIATRMEAMFFLATPHRGSDLAGTLSNILKITYGQKQYVHEIERNSITVASINDAFRHVSCGLSLHSFYETKAISFAKFLYRTVIVDKDSAILGYPNEQYMPLDADHRNVCKFDSPSDPNYKILRNSLSTCVDKIAAKVDMSQRQVIAQQSQSLKSLLEVLHDPEEDVVCLEEARVSGSCDWFINGKNFASWQQAPDAAPILWLSGNAASGKSTICAHSIRHLQHLNKECSYFFFKHGQAGQSTTKDFLLCVAYQLACQDDRTRSRLAAMAESGAPFSREDERTLWRKLFHTSAPENDASQTHYLVVDALDECSNSKTLFQLLSTLPKSVRVLAASRSTPDLDQAFAALDDKVAHETVSPSNTIQDLQDLVDFKLRRFPSGQISDTYRQDLQARILAKSAGSFLWVQLITEELRQAFSQEAMDKVLDDLPHGMSGLYDRMLLSLVSRGRSTQLTKAVLAWTIWASRPLNVNEIRMALKLDINETLEDPTRIMKSVCEQLVTVDQLSRIQLIHETAREYLINQDLVPALAFNKREDNARLAIACLKILSGDWFKRQRLEQWRPSRQLPPKLMDIRRNSKPDLSTSERAFAGYACSYFSGHVLRSSGDTEVLDLLCSFLEKQGLAWVEYLASEGDLTPINRAATNLKAFVERRARHLPPTDWRVQMIEAWSTDLIRVVARFRTQLLIAPSCINTLIPPLCPTGSVVAKSQAIRQPRLVVQGLKCKEWDDCLARIDVTKSNANAIACGQGHFAIGLSNGTVLIYRSNSLQQSYTLDHGERVKILKFSEDSQYLLSAGPRRARLWDTGSNALLWTHDTPRQPLEATFSANDELVNIVSQANTVTILQAVDGAVLDKLSLVEHDKSGFGGHQQAPPPSLAVFSKDCTLLAVSCRGKPVRLFDLESERYSLDLCRDDRPLDDTTVHYAADAIAFNPNPETAVVIVSFGDGELAAFSLRSGELASKLTGVFAHSLVCSPNGRSVVAASAQGSLQIFDFGGVSGDHLSLVYQIQSTDPGIKGLAFSQDSLRFFDIRARECRIWEPDFLVRKEGEGSSQSDLSFVAAPRAKYKGVLDDSGESEITAMCLLPQSDMVLCGKRNGSVVSYKTMDPSMDGTSCANATNVAVVALAAAASSAQQHAVGVADESGSLAFATISGSSQDKIYHQVSEVRLSEAIAGILFNRAGDRLLSSSANVLCLFAASGEQLAARSITEGETATLHPSNSELVVVLGQQTIRIFTWAGFDEVTQVDSMRLDRIKALSPQLEVATIFTGAKFIVEWRRDAASLECWLATEIDRSSKMTVSRPGFGAVAQRIDRIIGMVDNLLIFLDLDLWVCSLDLAAPNLAHRHFFLPTEWRGSLGKMPLVFNSASKALVVAVGGRPVTIRRGLDFLESWSAAPFFTSAMK